MKQDYTEFEAKFYPINKEEYRKKLQNIGAILKLPERKMRRAIIDARFFKQLKCDYIRVRDEGNGVVRLSAKTHAREGAPLSDQQEIDIVVNDYQKTIKILEVMGFRFDLYQETLRETWTFDGAEIEIDTYPGLEPYSEIEATSEAHVKKIAEQLGFDWNNRIITSAVEIYSKVYGLSIEQVLDNMKHSTFEDNAFSNLS